MAPRDRTYVESVQSARPNNKFLNLSTESDDKKPANIEDVELFNEFDMSTDQPISPSPQKIQKLSLWDDKKNPYASGWANKVLK